MKRQRKATPTAAVPRLSYTIQEFTAATGLSRNRIYAAIARGDLKSFKDGKRRMIGAEAGREYIALRERLTAEGLAA